MIPLVFFVAVAVPNPHPWETRGEVDGVTLSARAVPDSSLLEWRGAVEVPYPVARVCALLRDLESYPQYMPYLQSVTILPGGSADVRLAYFRVEPPVISARDFAQRIEYRVDSETGVCTVEARLANHLAPPPPPGVERMAHLIEHWTLEPLAPDRTRIEYRYHSDPGGMVPDWLVNRSGTSSIPELFERLRRRLENAGWRPNE